MLFFVQAYEKNLELDEIHIYNRWISFSIKKKNEKVKRKKLFLFPAIHKPRKIIIRMMQNY